MCFIIVWQFCFYSLLIVESFPPANQSLSMGLVDFITQMGKFLAPFLVRVSEDNNIDPIITMSVVLIIAFPIIFVKETMNKDRLEKMRADKKI